MEFFLNISWKTLKNNGRLIILQRRDLPHHLISAHIGDENSWWGSAFYNFSYIVKLGSTEKYIIRDIIINDIDIFYKMVNLISKTIKENNINNILGIIISNTEIIANGKEDYVEKYPQNNVVRPYQILINNENERERQEVAESIAKAIKQLLKK